MRVGEERTHSHGETVAANRAPIEGYFHHPDLGWRMTRAMRPNGPANGFQIGTASGVMIQLVIEFQHGLRVIGHANYVNRLASGQSSAQPYILILPAREVF